MTPLEALRKVWGYPAFREPQERVIEVAMSGRDALVVMPTGGGKSLCYQVPGVVGDGLVIVVSPLISLMRDQVEALKQNGVAAAALNSALNAEGAAKVWEDARSGALKLLYVSPERLAHDRTVESLRAIGPSLLAIDEAHCVSQWGPDFRPDYARLGFVREAMGDPPTLALTATADAATRADIVTRLRLREPEIFVAGFDRPNIRYNVVPRESNAARQILDFIDARPGGSKECGIVYCLSRKKVEALTEALKEKGIWAAAYHAGLPMPERDRVQTEFLEGKVRVVVATVAFGMGIDKPDVRWVIHRDLPKSVEAYYQETGRAGRDGKPSEARLLFSAGDVVAVKRLIENASDPGVRRIEAAKLEAISEICASRNCRRRALRAYFGENVSEDCGNCDVCLNPIERYDATEFVVDALMTVYKTGQRYGVSYIAGLLRGTGARNDEHRALETYGAYKHRAMDEVIYLARQLVLMGFLNIDLTQFGAAKLTPATKPVLREGRKVELDAYRLPEPKTRKKKIATPESEDVPKDLFEHLRQLRSELAREAEMPAYIVFDNKTLEAIASARPQNLAAMASVPGVGETKLARYGERFVSAVKEFAPAE